MDAFEPIIEEILKSDRQVHRKLRHTARRIFERLRDEHADVGGETIVKDAVRARKAHRRKGPHGSPRHASKINGRSRLTRS